MLSWIRAIILKKRMAGLTSFNQTQIVPPMQTEERKTTRFEFCKLKSTSAGSGYRDFVTFFLANSIKRSKY
ncbi:MAG TPA: hypothetical protein VMX56_08325 [Anaerolineales bacterium]|nr:hypothetical protein [Anaerolineales bacterium]